MVRSVSGAMKDATHSGPESQPGPRAETPHDKLYTFDDVARLVCKGADPPAGLALHFRRWARPLEGLPNFPRPSWMSRREMVGALKKVSGAADVILGSLTSHPASFLMAPKYAVFDRLTLIELLRDLKGRCWDAIATPPLASAKGGVKRGAGDAARIDGKNLQTLCAGAILLAWQEIHGELPGSRNPHACEAARALFQLATDPIAGGEPRVARPRRGKNPLTSWRRPFEAALADSPILGISHDIYLLHLRTALEPPAVIEGVPGDLLSCPNMPCGRLGEIAEGQVDAGSQAFHSRLFR
jgi:hypothetical protein